VVYCDRIDSSLRANSETYRRIRFMDFGIFSFDILEINAFFSNNSTGEIIWYVFIFGGWLFLARAILYFVFSYLEEYKENKYTANWEWVVLAIDVPPMNVQTPRAVEQLFAHLAGAYDSPNIADRFRHGYRQRWFSFEIVSIEGYIQFIVWTEASFRDLVEAAVYAQYPAAEITEVEDYTKPMVEEFKNGTIDIWASDFTLSENFAYPIRTYEEFEHSISEDEILKDPMAPFLESFSRVGRGEQMWFQILIEPKDSSWKEDVIKEIKNLIGEKVEKSSSGVLSFLTDNLITREIGAGIREMNAQLAGGVAGEAPEFGAGDDSGPQNKLQFLTPGQRKVLEGMEDKISKIGFRTKMRGMYLARNEVFHPERGVNSLIGAVNQYNIPSSNSIVPSFSTSAAYFAKNRRIKYRKRILMDAFSKRRLSTGANPFILNIEELATVWHFPMSHVKTPLLEKSSTKRSEPPSGLPVSYVSGDSSAFGIVDESDESTHPEKKSDGYRTDAGSFDYSDDMRFG
jgi:hypothetical protein